MGLRAREPRRKSRYARASFNPVLSVAIVMVEKLA